MRPRPTSASEFAREQVVPHPLRRASDFPRGRPKQFWELAPFVAAGATVLALLLVLVNALGLLPSPATSIRLRVGEIKAIDSTVAATAAKQKGNPGVAVKIVDGQVQLSALLRSVSDLHVTWADGRRQHFVVVAGAPMAPLKFTPVARPLRSALAKTDAKRLLRPLTPIARPSELAKKNETIAKLIDIKRHEDDPKENTKPKGQVIELLRPAEERRPENAKYVSEFDSSVPQEMKSKHRHLPPSPAPPSVEGTPRRELRRLAKKAAPPKSGKREKIAAQERVDEKKAFEPAPAPESERRRFALLDRQLKIDPSGTFPRGEDAPVPQKDSTKAQREEGRAKQDPREGSDSEDGDPDRIHDLKDVMPSRETLRSIAGGPVNDYLKGVEEGDRDMLNSRSWKFASFFNRVKRGVAQQWKPGSAYMRRDPNGNVYGLKDRYTVLHVTLDAAGSVKGMRVHQDSGLDFLDREAVKAFQDAQPFPNPPKGLLDQKAEVGFLFGFYFEISTRPQFRIFKYNN